jgi:hypothetical protein
VINVKKIKIIQFFSGETGRRGAWIKHWLVYRWVLGSNTVHVWEMYL